MSHDNNDKGFLSQAMNLVSGVMDTVSGTKPDDALNWKTILGGLTGGVGGWKLMDLFTGSSNRREDKRSSSGSGFLKKVFGAVAVAAIATIATRHFTSDDDNPANETSDSTLTESPKKIDTLKL